MKRLFIAILIFLIIAFKTDTSHAGPVEMVLDNFPLFMTGFIVIVAISCAYYQSPEYQRIIQRLRESISTYPTVGKTAAALVFEIATNIDDFIPALSIFETIDTAGIKSAAKKVRSDIGLGNYGNCEPGEHRDLQDRVENACGSAYACLSTDSTSELNSKIGKLSKCINSRKIINDRCYNGGDDGHKQAIKERLNAIQSCQRFLTRS